MHTRACSDKSSTATGLHGEARLPARPNLCRARAGVRTPGPLESAGPKAPPSQTPPRHPAGPEALSASAGGHGRLRSL